MSGSNVETLLTEFYARLRSGRRDEAMALIEPELPNGNLHVVLAYATEKIQCGDGLAAVSLLLRMEQYFENSHYALVAGVAARLLTRQIGDWGQRAERQLSRFIESNINRDGLVEQIQHYIQLCRSCGVSCDPDLRSSLRHFGLTALPDNPIKARFVGYCNDRPRSQTKIVSVPPAALFLESKNTGWRPRVDQQSEIDVGEQDFEVYRNVRLYMLPHLYGLLELDEGVFFGDIIGGCNPHCQGLLTERGAAGQCYKNLADPVLAQYPEIPLPGSWLVPFRLAGTYYFHFLAETIQTIYESQTLPTQSGIVLPKSEGFFNRIPREVYDSATRSVRDNHQDYHFLQDGIYRMDEVMVPGRIKYARITYQKFISQRLGLNSEKMTRALGLEILYVARRPGLARSVTNEETLFVHLRGKYPGFRHVYLEDLSFTEQISAFQTASVVIAPHGGGLTNISFCGPGTAVIEFNLPDSGMMYWHICFVQRMRYLAYVPEFYDPVGSKFLISPERLGAAIEFVAGLPPPDLSDDVNT